MGGCYKLRRLLIRRMCFGARFVLGAKDGRWLRILCVGLDEATGEFSISSDRLSICASSYTGDSSMSLRGHLLLQSR